MGDARWEENQRKTARALRWAPGRLIHPERDREADRYLFDFRRVVFFFVFRAAGFFFAVFLFFAAIASLRLECSHGC